MGRKHRRCTHEILYKILRLARKGMLTTPLFFKANLNYYHLMRLLKRLKKAGLIRETEYLWFTTEKGKQFIKAFEELEVLRYCS